MFNAIVTHRMDVAPELMILRVAPDGWKLPKFNPGQFGVIGLPGSAPRSADSKPEEHPPAQGAWIKRAYSIASSSLSSEYLEFYVAFVASGALTPRLFNLKVGSKIWLSERISGMFTLEGVPETSNVVLIATGTGIAPFVSMVRTYLAQDSKRRYCILHGARHSWDLGYQDEFHSMQRLCKNFKYACIVSRPKEEIVPWIGNVGYVQDLWERGVVRDLLGEDPKPENTHVFLCGNPGMIDSVIHVLEKRGFKEHKRNNPGQIHVERYW